MEMMKNPDFNRPNHIGYEVRLAFQAGYEQYSPWSSGSTKEHGFGWFHPFGIAEYWLGTGFDEEKEFEGEDMFGAFMLDQFESKYFSVYKMKDGLMYAWEISFGTVEKAAESEKKAHYTFVVGGTGKFKGANGILSGTRASTGNEKPVNGGNLPRALVTTESGLLRIPIEE